MRRLDAVLPLTLADLERARLLLGTLHRVEPLGTLWIVAPDAECAPIARALCGSGREIVPESMLLPELAYYRSWPGRATCRFGWAVNGWQVQQLVKLAAASLVRTSFYLTLDADVLCLRPVRWEDLVRGGRAIHVRYARNHSATWYRWAERLLGMRRSGMTHGVTPAVLNVEAVRALQRHLEGRIEPPLRSLSARLLRPEIGDGSWRSFLLRNAPFAEYALYGTFLEASGLYDRYHEAVGEWGIYANCVWYANEFAGWNPADLARLGDAWFTVVQSHTRIPVQRVAERLAPITGPGYPA